jgi:hypothetical protein
MTEREAIAILGEDSIRHDGYLYFVLDVDQEIAWVPGLPKIHVQGQFKPEQLEAAVWYMRNFRKCADPDCAGWYLQSYRRRFHSTRCQKRILARKLRGRAIA